MRTALIILAALAFALPLRAQQLPVKGYGQELVDQVMAKERGLLVVVMHVSPPGAANYPIIASNIGRIGKVADDDDMRVVTTGKTNLEVAPGGKRYEVELPLLDAKGGVVGALTVGWPLRKGRDEKAFLSQAEKIRNELRRRIPALEKLVELDP